MIYWVRLASDVWVLGKGGGILGKFASFNYKIVWYFLNLRKGIGYNFSIWQRISGLKKDEEIFAIFHKK